MSGARSWQTLFRVTLPLMRPAILSTMLLLFIRGMESYEVPRLIGNPARIEVFTTDIQRAITGSTRAVRPRQRAVDDAAGDLHASRCGSIRARRATRKPSRRSPARATSPCRCSSGAGAGRSRALIALMYVATLGLPLLTLVLAVALQVGRDPVHADDRRRARCTTTSSS